MLSIYTIMSCLGLKSASGDKFATTTTFASVQGPFSAGTGESMSPCGLLGFNYYTDPNSFPACGAVVVDMNPSSATVRSMPVEINVFPLIARTNPTVTSAKENATYCRTKNSANIISFDNRHSYRILWAGAQAVTTGGVTEMQYNMRLTSYEIVWWVPDLSTIEENKLVMTVAETATHELTQANIRIRNTWLRQMFNAYMCKHPVADASITDVTDLSGVAGNAFDTYNEPTTRTLVVQDDNMLPSRRDPKAIMAEGILERRKEARLLWKRVKVHRRPRQKNPTLSVVEVGATTNECNMSQIQSYHTAGRRFPINKRMEWDQETPDTDVDSTVREVCPRGVYVYAKYWYFQTKNNLPAFASSIQAPSVFLTLTGKVDRSQELRWQN